MDDLRKKTVRQLRKRQTECEKIFWNTVRNRKINGKKFLRQYPIVFDYYGTNRFFVADFYCHECKLIVEIDGSIHEIQKEYDTLRDFLIEKQGYKVIRFKNDEINDNLEDVINSLKTKINSLLTPLSFKERGDQGG